MRMRTVLGRTLVTVAVTLAATTGLAAPASAGTPYSRWCSDGASSGEIPILTEPVTLGIEIPRPASDPNQELLVCYSTTATDQTDSLVGGAVLVSVVTWTAPNPGVRVLVDCLPDDNQAVGPVDCYSFDYVQTFPAGLPTAGISPTCLVTVGGVCQLLVPLPWVQLQPVLEIGVTPLPPLQLPPALCVSVSGTCP